MSYVVFAPHFNAVAQGIGVPSAEIYAVSDDLANNPRAGQKIWSAGGAKETKTLDYCVITTYWTVVDEVLLIDIYAKDCPRKWTDADLQVFKKIIRIYKAARRKRKR